MVSLKISLQTNYYNSYSKMFKNQKMLKQKKGGIKKDRRDNKDIKGRMVEQT